MRKTTHFLASASAAPTAPHFMPAGQLDTSCRSKQGRHKGLVENVRRVLTTTQLLSSSSFLLWSDRQTERQKPATFDPQLGGVFHPWSP